jgi:Copper amine oxidase N-terminal domain.
MKFRKLLFICLSALLIPAAGCNATNGDAVSFGTGSAAENLSSESVPSSGSPSNSPVTNDMADPTYSAFLKSDKNGLMDNRIYTFANGSADAAPGDCLLMLNGEFSDADVIIKNDRVLVPVRVIQQKCGADVHWGHQASDGGIFPYGSDSGSSNMPLIIKIHNADGSIAIKMTVADVNGKTEAPDTSPVIENNTAYVPLRFVCDCFGRDADHKNQISAASLSLTRKEV